VCALVMAALYVRRRYFSRQPLFADAGGVSVGAGAADATGASVPVE
jgi:hypothetical protein